MVKVAIVGATGYTGLELIRILSHHPEVQIELITSESHSGKNLSDIHTHLFSIADYKLGSMNDIAGINIDVAFLALPHGISMQFVKDHGLSNYKIIDLSGDFRLSENDYNKWYNAIHICPEYLKNTVFGLPELYYDRIIKARLIANPGCYPTSAILPLSPFIKDKRINKDTIIIDSKSGVSGAGAKVKDSTHFPTVNENFSAYNLFTHRHTPEINYILNNLAEQSINVTFTPHLLPVNRGILSTIYLKMNQFIDRDEIYKILHDFYNDKPFVTIVNHLPGIKDVRGSNYCNIYANVDKERKMLILVAVIDNLVKGASGQAVQNMNIMFGIEQTTGLKNLPLIP
ncbi:MAG: N-acetyl-gamma-glutamyl-phosphate reductase [Bacteroidales bacterium]|nr:N-acetyl-gamma-glutamyl-phosphate reductase [Bacteroidales bacterium]